MLFYAVLPYAIWFFTRHLVSDYHALLLSTAPGFVYTIFRFAKERNISVTGLFLIAALFIGTAVDLLSGDADTMIRNHIRLMLAFGLFFLVTIFVKKPMALYFFADTAPALMPELRKSRFILGRKQLMPYFQGLTLLFVLRYVVMAIVNFKMFSAYGVDGYGFLIWWRVALNSAFGALILLASIFIAGRVREQETAG